MSQIVYSYIGKKPVYSQRLGCYIWPTPKAPFNENLYRPIVRRFLRCSAKLCKRRQPTIQVTLKQSIIDYLSINKWGTVPGLSLVLGKSRKAVSDSLHSNKHIFFRDGKYGQQVIWKLKEIS